MKYIALDKVKPHGGLVHVSQLEKAAVDAVEPVRCGECKHWKKDVAGCTEFVGYCDWANWMVGKTGFCIYGEKEVRS